MTAAVTAPAAQPAGRGGSAQAAQALDILVTVNASWNLVNFRRGLVAALLADGHRVTVLAPRDATSQVLADMGCRFIPLEMDGKGLSPLRDLALLARFARVFRRERPDVILGYTIKNNVYGALAARTLGIPFLPNVSGLGTAFLGRSWLRGVATTLYRAAFAGVPVVFFQNEDDRALFVDERLVARERTHVLPGSGIDLRAFAPAPPRQGGRVRFLLIARMLADKGVGEFVEAARLLRAQGSDAAFVLLGPADAVNRTAISRAVIDGWVEEGVVTYAGAVEDVRPFIADADCVVLPSYREGAPRTLIEAAAMARPVVATRVPGCTAVVDEGRSGLLCALRDSRDLAERMGEIVAMGPVARAAMGAAGRAKMEREFDEAHVVAAYREGLARHAVPRRQQE